MTHLLAGEVTRAARQFATKWELDSDAVDDVAQEAAIKALNGRSAFKGRSHCESWLYAIVRNEVYAHARRLKRVRKSEESYAMDRSASVEDGIQRALDVQGEWDLFRRTSASWVTAEGWLRLQLLYRCGWTVRQLAEARGTKASSVRAWRSKIFARFRAELSSN